MKVRRKVTKKTVATIAPTKWSDAEIALSNGERLMLFGPPGTGKTRFAYETAKKNGWLYYGITLTEDTSMTEIRGSYQIMGGNMVWSDGIVTSAWARSHAPEVKGVLVCLNEINCASPDCTTILHNVLDDDIMAEITLPTTPPKVVKPKIGKIFYVATMNGEPEDLREALLDRFVVRMNITEPHPHAIAALPNDLHALAKNSCSLPDERRLSLRPFFAFARLREKVSPETAARLVFGPRGTEILTSLKLAK